MLQFCAVQDGSLVKGKAVYLSGDQSFDFSPMPSADISIVMAYLYLCINSKDMCAKYVWGFSPAYSWKPFNLSVPNAVEGRIMLLGDYEGGLSWRIDESPMWESYFNKETGWYCIGDPQHMEQDISVEFATGTIAVLSESALKAIWIKPAFR